MKSKANIKPIKKVSSRSSVGEIRIIGGQWRGRKLKVHNKEGLRPTTDRIKETVFNWLMMDIREAKVLDCFAGSGSLGFEAISRGAQSLHAIELDKTAAKQLLDNVKTLQAQDRISVANGDFFEQSKSLVGVFDLVFVDPPFHKNLVAPTIAALLNGNLVQTGSLLYVEQANDDIVEIDSDKAELIKDKSAGQVSSRLYRIK